MRLFKRFLLIMIIAPFILLALLPEKINPAAWLPPTDLGFINALSANDQLLKAKVVLLSSGHGPEDIAIDAQGRIYTGLKDGRIIRVLKDGTQETFTHIKGGRPLGLAFDANQNLIVADAERGLISVSPSGAVTVLTTEQGGIPFRFTDDVDIAKDGKIYFSDASDAYPISDYRLDIFEARGHGRLLVYDPKTKTTSKLLDGLYFANGIALSTNNDFVVVNETGRYRITRYWLSGDKAGTSDIFVDNLPGFPDGISNNHKGSFWLAIPSPRNSLLDFVHNKPWLKSIIVKLPRFMQPSPKRHGIVVEINEQGQLRRSIQDSNGQRVYMITSVEQSGNILYLGNLENKEFATYQLNQ